eukprot:TRINITY_DN1640_c0_g1_i1.p3 TRINITY_DN1640_c0_g1~~TRINITY_DN1640_c0_g1_i1.p3  ORF type:complete len:490 (+),score=130.65 TRINITY_DN1640_c0_g1_i1:1216-2685(+)
MYAVAPATWMPDTLMFSSSAGLSFRVGRLWLTTGAAIAAAASKPQTTSIVFCFAAAAMAAPVVSHSLPTLKLNPALELNISVSGIHVAGATAYINSPANHLYPNLPPTNPRNGLWRLSNFWEAISGAELPDLSLVTADLPFPMYVNGVPDSIASRLGFVGDALVLACGRFPLPESEPGEIVFVDGATGEKFSVTGAPSEANKWYYVTLVFEDMDSDGDLDILTVRSVEVGRLVPPLGIFPFWGQLVWFEQPNAGPRSAVWQEHVLINPERVVNDGPDNKFIFVDLDGDGLKEVVATEFWSSTLRAYWTSDYTDPAQWRNLTLVQGTFGYLYDLKAAQLGGAGSDIQIVATNHITESDPEPVSLPAMFAVTMVPGWKTREPLSLPVRVLDDDLYRYFQSGAFSTGNVLVFHPRNYSTSEPPFISLSGDGAGEWYLHTPTSEPLVYSREILATGMCDMVVPQYFVDEATGRDVLLCGCLGGGVLHSGTFAN